MRPNLYLIGFMGTGKSVLGRRLAARLQMIFLDSDQEIEKQTGKRITEIFQDEGEPAFRAMERAFIQSGHPAKGCLVSCGGGLAVQPGMMELLKARGIVIALFASPATILKRTRSNRKRPLLDVPDPEARIRQMLAEREPVYRQAAACISSDIATISRTVQNLERVYLQMCKETKQ